MAATAYCTSNSSFHQHSLTPTRSQFSPVPRRTTLSPSTSFSSTAPILRDETSSIIKTIQSDENNNEHQIEDPSSSDTEQHLYIPSDVDMDSDDGDNDGSNQVVNDIDEEQFLAFVGLRSKMKKPIVQNLTAPRLTKRLASPVCLLSLPKFIERVRKALYIQIPNLKSLSIISDIELFCSTDDNAKAQSLLPRSRAQTRASLTLNKSPKKRKIPKTELIRMTVDALLNNTIRKKSKYVDSILQCNVVLDRLEQSTIDQIMKNSLEDDDNIVTTTSTRKRSSCNNTSPKTRRSLSITNNETTKTQTTITTTTTEKTVVKRKTTTTTTTEIDKPKRFKSVENDATVINNNDKKTDLPSLTYQRIYLKCFVCSKRQYVDKQATQSDVLHSHWLEHGADLSLNIYDSEIDSILTRVVEFFNLPKQHMLEGKIKTIFIYNSKEIRCTSTTTLPSNDSYIVID